MRRAATSTPTASVRNLLLAGALTLVVVLVLVAEMSTVETTPGASGREERLVKAVEERRVAEARRTGAAKRRRAEAAAAARGGEGGAADGAGAVRAATMVHMIHVPKTGGESAGIFLKRLGRNGFSMYRGKSGKESPHSIVDQSKVQ